VVNVPRDIQDWDDDDPDAEFHRNRWDYWQAMGKIAQEYRAAKDKCRVSIPAPHLWRWIEEQYGLRVSLDANGYITDKYEVVDEKKYTMFLLKFR
jgi:hypothetical protein